MKRIRMHLTHTVVAGVAAIALFAAVLPAQSQTSNQLVDQLKPKVAKTRSLVKQPGMNAEDAAFLKNLPTRGIRIDQRKKLDEIVAKQELPKVDVTIQFDLDSDRIRPDSIAAVNELGVALISEALKNSRIALNGHTDASGSAEYNQDLSDRRAASVRAYLIKTFGIPEDRLLAIGFGEERLKNNGDPEGPENRRVEVVNLTQG